jgi:hypothetical protein
MSRLKALFKGMIRDLEPDLGDYGYRWYSDEWIDQKLSLVADDLDAALSRWRVLYRSARSLLTLSSQKIESSILSRTSDEFKKQQRNQGQAQRQLDLLRNSLSFGESERSEFYPYRYLASEGFLPGYNFTRLPLRVFLPTSDTSGVYISRSREVALREFGPLNVIYYNGRKYRVGQLIVQDIESQLSQARLSKKAGYFLGDDLKHLEICPFSGLNLGDNANTEHFTDLLEMTESRAEEVDRISCEEEERVSRGFHISTYFSIDGGQFDRIRKAVVRSGENTLLNLRYIPAARLIHVNRGWRTHESEGFPIGMVSGDWRGSIPEPDANLKEDFLLIKLWTSNLADALYLEPVAPLGLDSEGVVTLQYALKRAVELHFQVEPNEIGVITVGDPEALNILMYEAAEGSLGVLSRVTTDPAVFNEVVKKAIALCRFDDPEYKGPASYDDLLSYYNQRDHKIIDRHLIQAALEKLRIGKIEIQSNASFANFDEQYHSLLRGIDPTSSTERKFLDYLYRNGLRLPDSAQMRFEGAFVQPDFFYKPRTWVFCDGTPHDEPAVQAEDRLKRQAIIAQGDEVWVYYYRDNLEEKIATRPDLFAKVR